MHQGGRHTRTGLKSLSYTTPNRGHEATTCMPQNTWDCPCVLQHRLDLPRQSGPNWLITLLSNAWIFLKGSWRRGWPGGSTCGGAPSGPVTCTAFARPSSPSSTWNSTGSFSRRLLKPSASMLLCKRTAKFRQPDPLDAVQLYLYGPGLIGRDPQQHCLHLSAPT